MFNENYVFDQPIGDWNTSKVTNMSSMFYNNGNFNQDITKWKVNENVNLLYMFKGATAMQMNRGASEIPSYTYFNK